jgi:hypothetical protein
MADCKSGHTFRNWARTLEFKPRRFCKPKTEDRIVEIVQEARTGKGCVRTQGAGHSFSQLLPTNDTLLSLDDMDHDVMVVTNGTEVNVSAGIRMKDLIPKLKARKLGLRNIGSITEQSIAGAALTGTHGTGIGLGSIPTQIIAARLVVGDGSIVDLPKGDPRLKAVGLSLGALGILTRVTLECVPHYQIDYNVYVGKFDHACQPDRRPAERACSSGGWCRCSIVTTSSYHQEPPPSGGPLGAAENRVIALFGIQHTPPGKDSMAWWRCGGAGPAVALQVQEDLAMSGDYEDMPTIPPLPVFHTESEYAIWPPCRDGHECIPEVEENDFQIQSPVEVRFVAAMTSC